MPEQGTQSGIAVQTEDAHTTVSPSDRVANLSPEQLRALAQIVADLMRREMRVEQERYRRPLPR